MEQQQVNRLYWITSSGDWILIVETPQEQFVMELATQLLLASDQGECGYAFFSKASPHMQWTKYRRHEGGSSRAPRAHAQIPKAIQLLELLHEPHASI